MRGTRSALVALAAAGVVTALPAHAGEPRTGSLDCDNDKTYAVRTLGYGDAVSLADSKQNFVMTYLELASGQVLIKESPGKLRLGTLSCTYTIDGKADGDTAKVRGFLTPRR